MVNYDVNILNKACLKTLNDVNTPSYVDSASVMKRSKAVPTQLGKARPRLKREQRSSLFCCRSSEDERKSLTIPTPYVPRRKKRRCRFTVPEKWIGNSHDNQGLYYKRFTIVNYDHKILFSLQRTQ